MKAFKIRWNNYPSSSTSSHTRWRSATGWTKNPDSAKVYTRPGFLKSAVKYLNKDVITIEVYEIQSLGEMSIDMFKEEF